jgi:hypothetical protein
MSLLQALSHEGGCDGCERNPPRGGQGPLSLSVIFHHLRAFAWTRASMGQDHHWL